MIYLDTSAIVKRYAEEPGSNRLDTFFRSAPELATAKIAYAEVHAALNRKRREGTLSRTRYDLAVEQFEAEWPGYLRIDLRDDILAMTRDLTRRHPLRGFDAIHLASALYLYRTLTEETTFIAADTQLVRAARAEHLHPINIEEG